MHSRVTLHVPAIDTVTSLRTARGKASRHDSQGRLIYGQTLLHVAAVPLPFTLHTRGTLSLPVILYEYRIKGIALKQRLTAKPDGQLC